MQSIQKRDHFNRNFKQAMKLHRQLDSCVCVCVVSLVIIIPI